MPLSVSELIKVDETSFAATGAFDAILDVDSRLFIDPFLLQTTTAPELKHSHDRLHDRFRIILKLLARSRAPGDLYWRAAAGRFAFPELQGLCIGYSTRSTSGSGMGHELRYKLLSTAKQIVDAGVDDPEIFELIGLFEPGIGADRISDMTGWIIIDDLLAYSERVFASFAAHTQPFEIAQKIVRLPRNPFSARAVILMPKDILHDLPLATSWFDIATVCATNARLRDAVNRLIARTWKDAANVSKADLRRLLLANPPIIRDLLRSYRENPARPYDFEDDPAGESIWHQKSKEYADRYPLFLSLAHNPTPEEVLRIVHQICSRFKDLIENNGLLDLLYDSSGKTKHESAAQLVFYGLADSYCAANNLDLSRETNGGRGPVDFKISGGYQSRTVVEVKLTSNSQLLHGVSKQLPIYQKAEKTRHAIYLVIDVDTGSVHRLTQLRQLLKDKEHSGQPVPDLVVVNGRHQPSASRA